jgi:hypothetical protein
MKCLVPLPSETAAELRCQKETGIGYQVVSVGLKDHRTFDQVVVSEGCIISVKGYAHLAINTVSWLGRAGLLLYLAANRTNYLSRSAHFAFFDFVIPDFPRL